MCDKKRKELKDSYALQKINKEKCKRSNLRWKPTCEENQNRGSDLAVIPTLASAAFTRSFSHSLSRSCFYLANERKEDCTRYVERRDPENRKGQRQRQRERDGNRGRPKRDQRRSKERSSEFRGNP